MTSESGSVMYVILLNYPHSPHVRVGYTTNLTKKLQVMKDNHVLPDQDIRVLYSCPGGELAVKQWYQRFKHLWLLKNYYEYNAEMAKYIDQMKKKVIDLDKYDVKMETFDRLRMRLERGWVDAEDDPAS